MEPPPFASAPPVPAPPADTLYLHSCVATTTTSGFSRSTGSHGAMLTGGCALPGTRVVVVGRSGWAKIATQDRASAGAGPRAVFAPGACPRGDAPTFHVPIMRRMVENISGPYCASSSSLSTMYSCLSTSSKIWAGVRLPSPATFTKPYFSFSRKLAWRASLPRKDACIRRRRPIGTGLRGASFASSSSSAPSAPPTSAVAKRFAGETAASGFFHSTGAVLPPALPLVTTFSGFSTLPAAAPTHETEEAADGQTATRFTRAGASCDPGGVPPDEDIDPDRNRDPRPHSIR